MSLQHRPDARRIVGAGLCAIARITLTRLPLIRRHPPCSRLLQAGAQQRCSRSMFGTWQKRHVSINNCCGVRGRTAIVSLTQHRWALKRRHRRPCETRQGLDGAETGRERARGSQAPPALDGARNVVDAGRRPAQQHRGTYASAKRRRVCDLMWQIASDKPRTGVQPVSVRMGLLVPRWQIGREVANRHGLRRIQSKRWSPCSTARLSCKCR